MAMSPQRARASTHRGFSLLEIIVVLVLMGVVAGLVTPTVARNASAGRERRVIGELINTMLARRLDAIRAGQDVHLQISLDAERRLTLSVGDTENHWKNWPLDLLDEAGESVESAQFTFDSRGRADVESLTLRSARSPVRIWRVEFDPVGGVPTAHRLKEASPS